MTETEIENTPDTGTHHVKRWPCASVSELCHAMADRVASSNSPRRRGLSMSVVVNLNTGAIRVLGPAYYMNAKDRGVLLNLCPFCGFDYGHGHDPKPSPSEEAP